jgi:hypothetical protein
MGKVLQQPPAKHSRNFSSRLLSLEVLGAVPDLGVVSALCAD